MKRIIKGNRDGLRITWKPTCEKLEFDGWYDSGVAIEGLEFTLIEFFNELGITFKDCRRVFRRQARKAEEDGKVDQ